MIGDSTANNSDEMKFNHVSVSSQGCTKCGTGFKRRYHQRVRHRISRHRSENLAVGFDWTNNASVNKVNATNSPCSTNSRATALTFHVQHEDIEYADQILPASNGGGSDVGRGEWARHSESFPIYGGVTGHAGHPAWDNSSGGNLKVRNVFDRQLFVGGDAI